MFENLQRPHNSYSPQTTLLTEQVIGVDLGDCAFSTVSIELRTVPLSRFSFPHASQFCVSAPSEAWRILRGASPRRVRPSQSPVSSVACMAEALPGNLVGITQILKGHWESARSTIHHKRYRISEQDTRSVHRETCRP